jgi:hypothetical protein
MSQDPKNFRLCEANTLRRASQLLSIPYCKQALPHSKRREGKMMRLRFQLLIDRAGSSRWLKSAVYEARCDTVQLFSDVCQFRNTQLIPLSSLDMNRRPRTAETNTDDDPWIDRPSQRACPRDAGAFHQDSRVSKAVLSDYQSMSKDAEMVSEACSLWSP